MRRPSLRLRPAIGSWPGGWTVRHVTAADLTALDALMPAEWSIGKPVGYAAARGGVLMAAGNVTWDRWARAWGWLNCRERVPARIMHVCALEMLALLRDVGEPEIRMIVNLSIEGAERWARRLGFAPDPVLTHPWGPVYKCRLSA